LSQPQNQCVRIYLLRWEIFRICSPVAIVGDCESAHGVKVLQTGLRSGGARRLLKVQCWRGFLAVASRKRRASFCSLRLPKVFENRSRTNSSSVGTGKSCPVRVLLRLGHIRLGHRRVPGEKTCFGGRAKINGWEGWQSRKKFGEIPAITIELGSDGGGGMKTTISQTVQAARVSSCKEPRPRALILPSCRRYRRSTITSSG
jgi:hypothetical protein